MLVLFLLFIMHPARVSPRSHIVTAQEVNIMPRRASVKTVMKLINAWDKVGGNTPDSGIYQGCVRCVLEEKYFGGIQPELHCLAVRQLGIFSCRPEDTLPWKILMFDTLRGLLECSGIPLFISKQHLRCFLLSIKAEEAPHLQY